MFRRVRDRPYTHRACGNYQIPRNGNDFALNRSFRQENMFTWTDVEIIANFGGRNGCSHHAVNGKSDRPIGGVDYANLRSARWVWSTLRIHCGGAHRKAKTHDQPDWHNSEPGFHRKPPSPAVVSRFTPRAGQRL